MRSSGCYTTEQLAQYSLGGGSPRWRRHTADHLAQCSSCRSEMAALERVDDLLGDLQAVDAPDLWDKVALNLAPAGRPRYAPVFAVRRKVYALTAAAVALGAFALFSVGPFREKWTQDRAAKVEHVDSHATMTWNDPFADRASLAVLAAEGANKEDM